jgi:hypothetical protein
LLKRLRRGSPGLAVQPTVEAYFQTYPKSLESHAVPAFSLVSQRNLIESIKLCQSYKVTPDVREIRMPDKRRAVEQLAKLCGWNEPEKLEHGASFRRALLYSLEL